MKLQPASRKELKRITLGVLICDAVMIPVLFLLSQFGIGSFDIVRILLGTAGGSAVAVFNFAIMCVTVQNAVDISDQKKMKALFQASYNGRLLLQAAWVVVALVGPQIHVLAGAAPLLFPNVVIFYLNAKGKLTTPSERKNPPIQEEEEPEDHLGSFEI